MNGMFAALIGIILAGFILVANIERNCAKYGEYDFAPLNLVIECSVKGNTNGEEE